MPPHPVKLCLHRRRLVAGVVALGMAGRSFGQPRTGPPLTLIVPAYPGGSAEGIGRVVADSLSTIMEVPVRVELVAGNGGVTGTTAIAAAPRDGSVIGLGISTPMVSGRLLSASAQYRPTEDFAWLAILGFYPNAMVLSTRSNHTNLEEWLAAARTAAKPLVFASLGTGTAGHLAGAYLRYEQGANLVHRVVERPGEGYAMLADGRAEVFFDGLPNALIEVPRSGNRFLAVTSAKRVDSLPETPSFGELWQQMFVVWIGLVAPRSITPEAHVRLASAVGVLLAEPRYAEILRGAGIAFLGLSGSATRSFVEAEILRSAKLIVKLNDEGRRP